MMVCRASTLSSFRRAGPADILARYASAEDIAKAFATFWTYPLACLETLVKDTDGGAGKRVRTL